MECNEIFLSYYLKYLGITLRDLNSGKSIFQCIQREKPINNWYFQHLIITNINKMNVFSISPSLYMDFSNYIAPFKDMDINELPGMIKIFFDSRLDKYSIRKMYRMTLDRTPEEIIMDDTVVRITKEILMNSLQSRSQDEISKIWLRKEEEVNQGRQYVILDNNRIISYCKVSDIDYSGGNLTVYTGEEYRNKGYGKLVTMGAIKWCCENGIIPVYWVDEKNTASVALARSLGFEIKSQELVVGINNQEQA